jgi:predicted neuraminidase
VKELAHATSEEDALAIPAPPEGTKHDKFLTHLHGSSVLIAPNEDADELAEFGHIGNRPLGLLEPTCIELEDGRILMLMRAEYGGFLWRAESSDRGRNWTNPTSLANLIRLPDGGIALIHNAVGGKVGERSPRDPLSIWISEDEMETWSVKADVIGGGYLAYPNPKILDGDLVFAYDHNRRQIRFVEVHLSE